MTMGEGKASTSMSFRGLLKTALPQPLLPWSLLAWWRPARSDCSKRTWQKQQRSFLGNIHDLGAKKYMLPWIGSYW